MEFNFHAIPAIFASIMFIILIYLVLKNNPKRKANRIAALLFTSLLWWSIVDIFVGISDEGDYDQVYIFIKLIGIAVLSIAPILIHLSIVFPMIRKFPRYLLYSFYALSFVFIAIMAYEGNVWIVIYRMPYIIIYMGYPAMLTALSISILLSTWFKSKLLVEKSQIKIIIFGMVIALAFLVTNSFVPGVRGMGPLIDVPSTTPLLVFATSIMYSIMKYKMLVIEAVTENRGPGGVESELPVELGFTYVIEEEGVGESYKAFRGHVTSVPGLCLTTT